MNGLAWLLGSRGASAAMLVGAGVLLTALAGCGRPSSGWAEARDPMLGMAAGMYRDGQSPFYAAPLGGVPIQIGLTTNPVKTGETSYGWATFGPVSDRETQLDLTYYVTGEIQVDTDPSKTDTSVTVPMGSAKVTFKVTCTANGSGYGTVYIVGTREGSFSMATLQVMPVIK